MDIPPIYLHSGFRTGSTWFWNCFRKAAGTQAYYEPFHEFLGRLTPAQVAAQTTGDWKSGHPPLQSPYFAEFAPLLRPTGGMPLYRERFAYRSYYSGDADQAAYLEALTAQARTRRRVPVFGFSRSQGRVPWLRRHCPGLHLVTWRNPWDQWSSIAAQSAAGNSYFAFRYYLIGCIGRHESPYRSFFDGLCLPRPLGDGDQRRAMYLNAFFRSTPPADRFRIFLRVVLLDMMLSIPAADMTVDLNRLSEDLSYREHATLSLRELTGLPDLSFTDCSLPHSVGALFAGCRDALAEAIDIAERKPLPGSEAVSAWLADHLRETLRRLPSEPDGGAVASDLPAYLVKYAIRIANDRTIGSELALAFLQDCYGAAFQSHRTELARIAADLAQDGKEWRSTAQNLARLLFSPTIGGASLLSDALRRESIA